MLALEPATSNEIDGAVYAHGAHTHFLQIVRSDSDGACSAECKPTLGG